MQKVQKNMLRYAMYIIQKANNSLDILTNHTQNSAAGWIIDTILYDRAGFRCTKRIATGLCLAKYLLYLPDTKPGTTVYLRCQRSHKNTGNGQKHLKEMLNLSLKRNLFN